MHKKFKHALHREITKAIIKAIKNRVPKINPLSDTAILSARAAIAKAKGK